MKKVLAAIAVLITQSAAWGAIQRNVLIDCNPPTGSHLQEVTVFEVGGKIYLSELAFSGRRSPAQEISLAEYVEGRIYWNSANGATVHMEKTDRGWAYKSSFINLQVFGYCE
jgi:hypothetical protein